MFKKDLGLLVLILVVGAAVALINPRFLSPINLSNTANLIGLFGLFSIAEAFVIITGGIELSVGSVIALLGVIFIDLIANVGLHWGLALPLVIGIGVVMGAVHGFLVTRMRLQPFVVTLCGLLIYRGIARFYTDDATAGFAFGVNFPDARVADDRADLWRAAQPDRLRRRRPGHGGAAAPHRLRALSVRGRQERGGGALFRHPHRSG